MRFSNGTEPVDAFLSSYKRNNAGCDHDLVLLCKGFPDRDALEPVRRRGREVNAAEFVVSDRGFDVTAYSAAASALPHRRLCFVNSFSTVIASHWLARLSSVLDEPGVGVVGASGSWASHRSLALSVMRLPNGYRGALGERSARVSALRSLSDVPRQGRLRRYSRAAADLSRELVGYSGFPAPHVRTNAFVIERELLLSLRTGTLRTKSAACRFEGGIHGLTGQIRGRGLAALIVGCDGIALAPEAWPDADIFWQGRQCQLLVADNQTRTYQHGGASVREALARRAWGPRARPR